MPEFGGGMGERFGPPGGGAGAAGAAGATGATGPNLTPVAASAATIALNGQLIQMTGAFGVTSPAAATGTMFGVEAISATGGSQVTVSAVTGAFIGLGVATGSTNIPLGVTGAAAIFLADGTNFNLIGGAQDSGWKVVGATGATSFGANWSSSGGARPPVAYRLSGNIVRMQGTLTGTGASGSTAFTLPAGFRPTGTVVPANTGNQALSEGFVVVTSAGLVQPGTTASGSPTLDGITFTVD